MKIMTLNLLMKTITRMAKRDLTKYILLKVILITKTVKTLIKMAPNKTKSQKTMILSKDLLTWNTAGTSSETIRPTWMISTR
jgi:hypothetical protein